MKVDTTLEGPLAGAGAEAVEAEQHGYDGIWTTEIAHDPFFPLLLAADRTSRLDVGTGIAVAFARNPMTLAYSAWDLQAHSGGRFFLGLGSQIKPHIERRYSMPWGQPAARMREFVAALKAIWSSWQEGTPLEFEGVFYRHTLMTPFFTPSPLDHAAPRVLIAAVGEGMTRVAGEIADGMLVHAFTTEHYLRTVTLPLLSQGLSERGVAREDFQVVYPALVATGVTDQSLDAAVAGTRKQIAFYASTPAYRGILEAHGWEDLQPELHTLSKQDRWADMGKLITDEVLTTFAAVGSPDEVARLLVTRFDGVVDRIRVYQPYDADPTTTLQVAAGLRDVALAR